MQAITEKINAIQWNEVYTQMNEKGFSLIENILDKTDCQQLINNYEAGAVYRKTVSMERYRFGLGEYKYFDYPLPSLIQTMREALYAKLSSLANDWMRQLAIDTQFPLSLKAMLALCHRRQQLKPTPLILRYGKGGFNTMHQDVYGDMYFPMQAVLLLNDPENDYSGGEFVLLEQLPRAQSKAYVLQLKQGDMLIFTTRHRPVRGKKGHYRVQVKHGVSPVLRGERHSLGIIFHDAQS